ncbi:MAG: ATP-binding protein [Acidobacteriaceae bacterium]
MLPGSHGVPINDAVLESLHSPQLLADAFSQFISASSLLEGSYRDLQREVKELGTELAERNAALTRSLAENDQMRGALQQMIDSMPCGVLVLDTAERVVTINPEGRRLLQLGDARVQTVQEVSAGSKIKLEALTVPCEGEAAQEICLTAEGGHRWLAISNRRLEGMGSRGSAGVQRAGSQRAGLERIWIFRDITAVKEAEQEREAARNATALAEVSAVLAHEIRNPLASMELFAGLVADDPEHAAEWVSNLRAGIRLLSATVNNVLSVHGGGGALLVPVELSECVRCGVEFVRPIAEQAGVALRVIADEELRVQGNENQLRQILLNLVCNAIRHTPAGGSVDVTVRRTVGHGAGRARVVVADTGCGMSAEQMEKVFDAGFSVQGDTPGLGLAVCKRLMTAHGGEICVGSELGCGSTFQLEFPTI